jgi:hypothetical protein
MPFCKIPFIVGCTINVTAILVWLAALFGALWVNGRPVACDVTVTCRVAPCCLRQERLGPCMQPFVQWSYRGVSIGERAFGCSFAIRCDPTDMDVARDSVSHVQCFAFGNIVYVDASATYAFRFSIAFVSIVMVVVDVFCALVHLLDHATSANHWTFLVAFTASSLAVGAGVSFKIYHG